MNKYFIFHLYMFLTVKKIIFEKNIFRSIQKYLEDLDKARWYRNINFRKVFSFLTLQSTRMYNTCFTLMEPLFLIPNVCRQNCLIVIFMHKYYCLKLKMYLITVYSKLKCFKKNNLCYITLILTSTQPYIQNKNFPIINFTQNN